MLKSIVILFNLCFAATLWSEEVEKVVVCDFSNLDQAESFGWHVVNDDVMGGISRSTISVKEGVLHFTGTLSLENNGGFASFQSKNKTFELEGATGITLKVKGDGRTYQLRLETSASISRRGREYPVSFSGSFATEKDVWTEVHVPFSDLKQGFRGESLEGHPFDPADIQMMGILLADKNPGPFSLQVASIRARKSE